MISRGARCTSFRIDYRETSIYRFRKYILPGFIAQFLLSINESYLNHGARIYRSELRLHCVEFQSDSNGTGENTTQVQVILLTCVS
jgi:hypothetical protein